MDPVVRRLLTPGPAEIIRASQKDGEFISRLNDEIQDVVRSIFGQRRSSKWGHTVLKVSEVVYHSLTNLMGHQTLGEEYCGVLQVDGGATQTPGRMRLACMILFATFGSSGIEVVIKFLQQYLSRIQSHHVESSGEQDTTLKHRRELLRQFGETGIDAVAFLRHYLPFLGQLHLALFYVQGHFYHFSKRVLGIYYLLVRKSFANQDERSRQTLKYLMVISIINSFLTGVSDSVSFFKSRTAAVPSNTGDAAKLVAEPESEIDATKRCTLCLDRRTNSSLTPCGHLFCWDCILDWLRSKQECPVCREQFPPSRVVPLQNYN